MAKKSTKSASVRIYEATLGPHGVVFRGVAINQSEAVARRSAGLDVVVSGEETRQNRIMAQTIENAVGPNIHHDPHLGPDSLPHYQPHPRPPDGHCFYERVLAKAKKTP